MDLITRLESINMDGISMDLLGSLVKYFPTDEEVRMLVIPLGEHLIFLVLDAHV